MLDLPKQGDDQEERNGLLISGGVTMKRMSVAILAVLACLLFVGAGQAEEGNVSDVEISFAGIKFGSTQKEADALLKKNGLKFVKIVDGVSYYYKGSVGGSLALVSCDVIDGTVEEFWIIFDDKPNPKREFMEKTRILSEKYGEPQERTRSYQSPFNAEDDGSHFETGVRLGRIEISDLYRDKSGSIVYVGITTDNSIIMVYRSKKCLEYRSREVDKANEIF